MPDLKLLKTLSPLGMGWLLAVAIFAFYRLDFLRERQNHRAERERQERREERLLNMIEHWSVTACHRMSPVCERVK